MKPTIECHHKSINDIRRMGFWVLILIATWSLGLLTVYKLSEAKQHHVSVVDTRG